MQPTIEITYAYSDKHQQEEWISTGKTARKSNTLVIAADKFTPDQRAVFVEFWQTIKATNINKIELCHYNSKSPFGSVGRAPSVLDADPTPDQIVEQIKAMTVEYSIADGEVKAQNAERTAKRLEQERRHDAAIAANNQHIRQQEADIKAKREAAEAEKMAWIEAHGSMRLKSGTQNGYPMSEAYEAERAEVEYPGYTLDSDDFDNMESPSEDALCLLETVKADHPGADVYIVNYRDYRVPTEAIQVDDPHFSKFLYRVL